MAPQGSLASVKSENAKLVDLPPPVALIIGGTSGIGRAIIRTLLAHTKAPRIYFVGRNREAASEIIAEAHKSNPAATVVFFQYDVYILANIARIVADFVQQETSTVDGISSEADVKLNLLVNSTGTFNQTTKPTLDNLQPELVSRHYSRTLSINLLLPYLQHASSTPLGARVFTIQAAGQEAPFSNLDKGVNLRDAPSQSFVQTVFHATALQSLMMEELSIRYPEIAFLHLYPGIVLSGIFRELPWYLYWPAKIATPLLWVFTTSDTEVGERMVRLATDEEHKTGAHLVNYDGALKDWRVGKGWKQWKTKEEWEAKRAEWRAKVWVDFKETVGGIEGVQIRDW